SRIQYSLSTRQICLQTNKICCPILGLPQHLLATQQSSLRKSPFTTISSYVRKFLSGTPEAAWMHAPDRAIPLGVPPRDGHTVLSAGPNDLRSTHGSPA